MAHGAGKSLPVPIPRPAPQLVRVRPAAEQAVGAIPEPVQLGGQDVLLDEALWELGTSVGLYVRPKKKKKKKSLFLLHPRAGG